MTDSGLSKQDVELVTEVITRFPEVKQASIFGSRAKGTYKNGSDVDIALKGENLNLKIISAISFVLNEELSLPYKFDVLDYNSLSNSALKEHINRVGKCILMRE